MSISFCAAPGIRRSYCSSVAGGGKGPLQWANERASAAGGCEFAGDGFMGTPEILADSLPVALQGRQVIARGHRLARALQRRQQPRVARAVRHEGGGESQRYAG